MMMTTTDFVPHTGSGSISNVLNREFGVIQYSPEENEQLIDLCKKAEISEEASDTLCPFAARSYKIITKKTKTEMTHDVPAIPNDVIQLIFLKLNLNDFLAFAKTCKRIYLISKADLLWEDQMHKKFPNITILKYINPNEITITECKTTKVKYESQIKIYTKKIENTLRPRRIVINKMSKQLNILKEKEKILSDEFEIVRKKDPNIMILNNSQTDDLSLQITFHDPRLQVRIRKIRRKISLFDGRSNENRLNDIQTALHDQKRYEHIIQLAETNHNTINLLDLDEERENILKGTTITTLSAEEDQLLSSASEDSIILFSYEQQVLKEIAPEMLQHPTSA